MSLRKYPECGNLVSSDVKQCIHCGKKLLDGGRLIGGMIIALFFGFPFVHGFNYNRLWDKHPLYL